MYGGVLWELFNHVFKCMQSDVQYMLSALLLRRRWSSSTLRATSRSPCWRTTSAKRAASRSSFTNTSESLSSPTMIWKEPKGLFGLLILTK